MCSEERHVFRQGGQRCDCGAVSQNEIAPLVESQAENERLRGMLVTVGTALETVMLEWNGTLDDPKLLDAYQGLKMFREWRS